MSGPKKRKQQPRKPPLIPRAPAPDQERKRGFEPDSERGGESDIERGPTSDVGGPRGIERGVGIETGEETP